METGLGSWRAMRSRKMGVQSLSRIFGIFICAFLAVPIMSADGLSLSQENPDALQGVHERGKSRGNDGKRRDPFQPIKKIRSISSLSRPVTSKSSSPIAPIKNITDPTWKLLGIIHGQYGHQAVIQISPGKRVFASPGLELARSGWVVKTVSQGEVFLEHQATISAETHSSLPRTFLLSFQTPGKS